MQSIKESFLQGLNKEQYEAVKINTNAVVSAGAGSGKTRVLAKRFVYLIAEKNIKIEKIVALTFTKKAATEMTERIYAELLDIKNTNPSDNINDAIENFHSANISTIDSFCNNIAKLGCNKFGISPDFTIDQEGSIELASSCALNFFLKHRNNKSLHKIIEQNNLDDFINSLFTKILTEYVLISQPLDLEKSITVQDKKIEQLFSKYMIQLSKQIQIIENIEPSFSEFSDNVKTIILNIGPTPSSVGDKIFEPFLRNLYQVDSIDLRKGPRNEIIKECKEAIKEIKNNLVPKLLQLNHFVRNKPLIMELVKLVDELQTEYITQKKQMGILNYADVAQLSIDILKKDSDIRNFYKNEIDAIMIDEFQDNNSLQRDLLFLLSEKKELNSNDIPSYNDLCEDKLFFVGDDKQSIYLFRGADVSVFRKLTKDFKRDNTKDIMLNTNYRSETNLINIFNYIFTSVFYSNTNEPNTSEFTEESLENECFFAPITPYRNTKNINPSLKIFIADSVRFKYYKPLKSQTPLTAEECEAFTLANEIKKMHSNKTKVRDSSSGLERPCKWSDFAILFRTTTHQSTVERFLRQSEIPYKAVQQKGIFNDAPINDIFALLKLAVYPWDNLTYAQVLHSPFVKIDDYSFAKIFLQHKEAFDITVVNELDDKNKKPFTQACELFNRVKQYIKEKTNAELITNIWNDEAYKYLLLTNNKYHRFLELYDYLFEIARKADAEGLSSIQFIDLLEGYITNTDKLDNIDLPIESQADQVQLLTIHKSKGLEYPIVCIPFSGSEISTGKEELVFYSKDLGISFLLPETQDDFLNIGASNIFYNELKTLDAQKHIAELKRLLYVAMTRAECHIIITGKRINKGRTSDPKYTTPQTGEQLTSYFKFPTAKTVKTTMLNLLIPGLINIAKDFPNKEITISEILPTTLENSYKLTSYHKKIESIDFKKLKQIYENTPIKTFNKATQKVFSASHLHEETNNPYIKKNENIFAENIQNNNDTINIEHQAQEISATELGTLTHLAIESFFTKKSINLPAKYEHEILSMRNTFIESDIGQKAILATEVKPEYSFITKYNSKKIIGQIDLLFETNNTIYIIDYKTDKIENPTIHQEQLSVYKKAVTDLYAYQNNTKPIKAFLFYLRSGNTIEIK